MKSKYTDLELATLKAIGDAGPGGISEDELNGHALGRLRRRGRTPVINQQQKNRMVHLLAGGRRIYARLAVADDGTWEAVEVMGHQLHIGRTSEVEQLGKQFLRIAVPAYVHDRMQYVGRVFTLAPGAIFRRTALSEAEARARLGRQTNGDLGMPLPGRRLDDARINLGGYDLPPHRAAELLGLEPAEYQSIASCTTELSESRADELIADAAWSRIDTADARDLRGDHHHADDMAVADEDGDYMDDDGDEDDDCPSDATAEAPAAEGIERLDYTKAPRGYRIDFSEGSWWASDPADQVVEPLGDSADAACAAAWAAYKIHNDPPGMPVDYVDAPPGWWVYTTAAGGLLCLSRHDAKATARHAAWARHDRRLALWRKLADAEVLTRQFIADDLWPAILSWSDDQVAEVERWLIDSTAELPEVLGG